VRGEGVFWALDLVADPETREPLPPAEMGRLKGALVERGLLPFVADNRIHVVPPCVVTADEVAQAAEIYDEVLGTVAV
jgi:taurine--2-oxoglutarate transaminase